jgi:hypothetical protein
MGGPRWRVLGRSGHTGGVDLDGGRAGGVDLDSGGNARGGGAVGEARAWRRLARRRGEHRGGAGSSGCVARK